MKLLVPVLAAAVALAGCASPDESLAAESLPAGGAPAGAAAAANATAAAGETAGETAVATKEVVTPLAVEGSTDGGVCAFTPAGGQCAGADSSTSEVPLEAPGTLTRVTATIEWMPATPATAEMQAYLVDMTDGALNFTDQQVMGPSPLSIDWDLTPYVDRDMRILLTNMRGSEIPVGFFGAEAEQAYSLTGEIRSETAA